MEESEWKKVETEILVPQSDGDEVSGKYLGVQHKVGENESELYTIEREDGSQASFWGSTVLDGKMIAAKVGQQVKVVFLGRVKKEGKKEYKDYDVFLKPMEEPKEEPTEEPIPTQKMPPSREMPPAKEMPPAQ